MHAEEKSRKPAAIPQPCVRPTPTISATNSSTVNTSESHRSNLNHTAARRKTSAPPTDWSLQRPVEIAAPLKKKDGRRTSRGTRPTISIDQANLVTRLLLTLRLRIAIAAVAAPPRPPIAAPATAAPQLR